LWRARASIRPSFLSQDRSKVPEGQKSPGDGETHLQNCDGAAWYEMTDGESSFNAMTLSLPVPRLCLYQL
jgi:hypothetical protein